MPGSGPHHVPEEILSICHHPDHKHADRAEARACLVEQVEEATRNKNLMEKELAEIKAQVLGPAPDPDSQSTTPPIPEPLSQALANGQAHVLQPGDKLLILVPPGATEQDLNNLQAYIMAWCPGVDVKIMSGPVGMMKQEARHESPLSKLLLPAGTTLPPKAT